MMTTISHKTVLSVLSLTLYAACAGAQSIEMLQQEQMQQMEKMQQEQLRRMQQLQTPLNQQQYGQGIPDGTNSNTYGIYPNMYGNNPAPNGPGLPPSGNNSLSNPQNQNIPQEPEEYQPRWP